MSRLLAAVLAIRDAGRALSFEQDPRRMRGRLDAKIGSAARRPEVSDCGRAAHPFAGRQLVVAGAFLRCAVEIVVAGNAELARARDHRFDQRMRRIDVGRPQRAVGAVVLARAANVVLEQAEPR